MVGTIRKEIARPLFGSPSLASHGWNGVNERDKLSYVVAVCAGYGEGKRNALPVGDDMMFGAEFAAVRRIRARLLPPKTARTLEESTTTRDQSSWSDLWSSASIVSYTRCHTPNSCHLAKRRQQVIPDPHPISCGRYSHGIPVRKTNRIPVSAPRLGTAGRPLLLGSLSGGKRGSMSVHSSSGSISRAICSSMQPVAVNPDTLAQNIYRNCFH